jgi:hypothetical protein
MALDIGALIRDVVVPTVARVAGNLRVTIGLERVTGPGPYGPAYAASVPVDALVEFKAQTVASQDGTEHVSAAVLTFFEPLVIRERDRVTINGVKANVIAVGGLLDPETGLPYLPQAWTGK